LYSIEVVDVKSPAGSIRAERAAVTRRRIADEARRLFATRGYGATTLTEVAASAGVAVQTVYAVFGSKANILRELRERLRDEPAADAAFSQALAASDPEAVLGLFARSIRIRWEAGHDIVAIHVEARSVDPAIRDEVDAVLAVRRRGIGALAESLATRKRRYKDVARISAMIDALTLPEVYAELTGIHGWSPDAYEAWLATALRRMT
jgi:AcrR family transcriptional regulator